MITLRMTGDKVCIKPDPVLTQISVIFLPQIGWSIQWSGTIVAIGPGNINRYGKLIPTKLKVGQHVTVYTGRAVEVTYNGEDFMFTHESDIILSMEEEVQVLSWQNQNRPTRREWEDVMHNTLQGKVTRPEKL